MRSFRLSFWAFKELTKRLTLLTSSLPHEWQQNDEFTMAFVCQQKQQSVKKRLRGLVVKEKCWELVHTKSSTTATIFCNARCLFCFMSHHFSPKRLGYYIAGCCVLYVVMLLSYDFSYFFLLFMILNDAKKNKKLFPSFVYSPISARFLLMKCLFVVHHSCFYINFN